MDNESPICPACHGRDRQIRDGSTTAGSQRYRCKHCGCRYTPQPKSRGYDDEIRLQALTLFLEGVSLRMISRILAVNHQSVANWVNHFAGNMPEDLPDSILETAVLDGLITYNPRHKQPPATPQN
ncbi:MAG: helix-turn-helix domain-containing protein [Anaerolineae bacterium]|nr:helix-turn-helix domain-containing protein [Anaerolineae bacterium]